MPAWPLAPLEIASGLVIGPAPAAELTIAPGGSTRLALDDVMRAALGRPPCVVAFSGGRDSSAVLALAADVARRESLAPPVAVTNRFPALPHTDEATWQELVVRHLGLADWVRIDHTDELDAVGPVAGRVLLRHGLLWPFNSHFIEPAAGVASGGTLLTGVGGDELFGSPWAGALVASMLRLATRPTRRRLVYLARVGGPLPVRRAVGRRHTLAFPWLRPAVDEAMVEAVNDWDSRSPVGFENCVRRYLWPSRYLQTIRRSLACVGGDHDAQVVHPLCEPAVLAALCGQLGWKGTRNRTEAMARLFGDLLPAELVRRPTKAAFTNVFVGGHTRRFVEAWSGAGVDRALVDPERLVSTWSGPEPDARSLTQLQAAWLAQQPEPRRPQASREGRTTGSVVRLDGPGGPGTGPGAT